ncbi:MAG TPA: hypothetical protein PKA58_14615, partial [Polyangium sp.]|nr:hypothetical protein [Polyangium sp.]
KWSCNGPEEKASAAASTPPPTQRAGSSCVCSAAGLASSGSRFAPLAWLVTLLLIVYRRRR